jgi:MFS family permease
MEQLERRQERNTIWAATVALSLAMLLASLGTSIANIALPELAHAFAAPFREVQAVVVVYLAALTVAVIVAGRLGDSRGLKPMLVAGLVLFTFASALCALSPTLWLLVAARALQGIGAAFLMTLAMALMRQTAGEARVGRAMGLLGTVSALGTALGPTLGGVLIPLTGWQGVFWVQVPLALVTLLLVLAKLPHEKAERRPPASSLWLAFDRSLLPMLIANVLVAAVMMATLVVGPFYLALAAGLGPASVGLVMAAGPAISIVSGIPSGRLVDQWGSDRVSILGLSLLALGAVLLAILPGLAGVAGYLLGILALTPGYQLFQAANNTAALAKVAKERRGTASGLLSLSRNLGLIAGASLMGAVFAWGVGTADFARASGPAFNTGMNVTFLLAAAMMVLALAITLGSGRLTPRVLRLGD